MYFKRKKEKKCMAKCNTGRLLNKFTTFILHGWAQYNFKNHAVNYFH